MARTFPDAAIAQASTFNQMWGEFVIEVARDQKDADLLMALSPHTKMEILGFSPHSGEEDDQA